MEVTVGGDSAQGQEAGSGRKRWLHAQGMCRGWGGDRLVPFPQPTPHEKQVGEQTAPLDEAGQT